MRDTKYLPTAHTIHEKVCPVCNNVVEVLPELGWEAEFHFTRDHTGRSVKCPGTGQSIPQGDARKRIVVRLKGNKDE